MISKQAFVPPLLDKVKDDYEIELNEWAALVESQYRDSLVLSGMKEAEDEDFQRRRWQPEFVHRLEEFLQDQGDGSAGAMSLAQSLKEAEYRGRGKNYTVWLGPAARQWLRVKAVELLAFLDGRYANYLLTALRSAS